MEDLISQALELEDGIIRPDIFETEKIRLLIVCKEPNGSGHYENPESFLKVWGTEKGDYPFATRVAELAHGVLDNFQSYNKISGNENKKLRFETLQRIAFVNVKKVPGKSSSDNVQIRDFVKINYPKIIKQINDIKPSHIILGLSDISISETLFPEAEFKSTEFGCHYAEWEDKKILHFYHPSARVGNAALYALLKVNFESLNWL